MLPDGTLEGFVGGTCARSTVLAQGLRLLAAGESGLLRISPSAVSAPDAPDDGVITVANPCLSGGALEIFMEAMIPPPLVLVAGDAPVAWALLRVGAALDYDVRPCPTRAADIRASERAAPGSSAGPGPDIPDGTAAVVVASHGLDEEALLRAALLAEVPYVALVASHRRGAAVLAGLGLPDELTARVSVPAGLDIGARSAPEIALSICAELLASRSDRSPGSASETVRAAVETAEHHGCCSG